jgi:transposase-like protein
MKNKRRNFAPDFKAKVALAALKEQKTLTELSAEYELQPTVISNWKSQASAALVELFADGRKAKKAKSDEELVDRLYRQIGQLQVELEWLKKKSGR